ncbi:MAG TPA: hypothetical protein VGL81_10300 [Polyangiaceae bacterium]
MLRPWRFTVLAALSSLPAVGGAFACSHFRDVTLGPPGDGGSDGASPVESSAGDGSSPFTVVQGLPAGEALTAVWGADPADVFAVGTNDVHYEYYQGSWQRSQAVLGRDLESVWGTSASDVYAVGLDVTTNTGVIEHFDGSAWTDDALVPTALYGVWGTGGAILAVGANGMIYGKHTGIPGWTMVLGDAGLPANPDVPAAPGEPILWGIAGTSISAFAMPADLDRIFQVVDESGFVNLDPAVDRTISFRSVFSVPGATGSYFFGTNYFGVTWLTASGPTDAATLGGDMSLIFQDRASPGAQQLFIYGIWGTSDQFLFTGDQGRIYSYAAGSDDFGPVASPTDATLYGVWGSSASDVWIVGDREVILHGSL